MRSVLEEEEEVPIEISLENDNLKQRSSFCLIGKLWTAKTFNAFGLLETMRKIWKPGKGMTAKEIEPNLFSFQFNHWRDMEKVLSMEPWHFDKHLLVLKQLDSGEQPSAIKFDSTPFWIRIYDMPLIARTERTIRLICERLGKVIEIDNSTMEGFSRSVRIRVLLNLNKPLRRGAKIAIPNAEHLWISFKYERLPSFCYICGFLGHLKRECDVVDDRDEYLSLTDEKLPFGDWLRASPLRQVKVIVEEQKADDNLGARKKLFQAFMQEPQEQTIEPHVSASHVRQDHSTYEIDNVLKTLEKCKVTGKKIPNTRSDPVQSAPIPTHPIDPHNNQPANTNPTLPNHIETLNTTPQPEQRPTEPVLLSPDHHQSLNTYNPDHILSLTPPKSAMPIDNKTIETPKGPPRTVKIIRNTDRQKSTHPNHPIKLSGSKRKEEVEIMEDDLPDTKQAKMTLLQTNEAYSPTAEAVIQPRRSP